MSVAGAVSVVSGAGDRAGEFLSRDGRKSASRTARNATRPIIQSQGDLRLEFAEFFRCSDSIVMPMSSLTGKTPDVGNLCIWVVSAF